MDLSKIVRSSKRCWGFKYRPAGRRTRTHSTTVWLIGSAPTSMTWFSRKSSNLLTPFRHVLHRHRESNSADCFHQARMLGVEAAYFLDNSRIFGFSTRGDLPNLIRGQLVR